MENGSGSGKPRKAYVAGRRMDRYRKKGRLRRQKSPSPGSSSGQAPVPAPGGGPGGTPWYRRGRVWAVVALLLAIAPAAALVSFRFAVEPGEGAPAAVAPPAVTTPEDQLLASMSLEAKVGQMVMVGFAGEDVDGEITTLVRDRKVGGVFLSREDIDDGEEVAGLNQYLQALAVQGGAPAGLLIAVDQEGGRTRSIDSIGPFYSQPMIGEMGKVAGEVAEQQASFAAGYLEKLGINTNLAPVVDVSDGWGSLMYARSYGEDASLVAYAGSMAVRGYRKSNFVSCPGHFPGQGAADEDPEDAIPRVDADRGQLEQRELPPFWAVIAEQAPMLMVGHVVVPALDPTERPATMSQPVITGLLRGELGYQGVVITDDMELAAIADNWDVGEAAVVAIEAGADMVLVAQTYEAQVAVCDAILAAARSGRLGADRVDQSVKRILAMKRQYHLAP